MTQDEKSTILEKIIRELIRKTLGTLSQSIERSVRRVLRSIGLVIGGVSLALVGLTLLAVGMIKWLALFMPTWLSWILVGIIVLLAGIALSFAGMNR